MFLFCFHLDKHKKLIRCQRKLFEVSSRVLIKAMKSLLHSLKDIRKLFLLVYPETTMTCLTSYLPFFLKNLNSIQSTFSPNRTFIKE